MATVTALTAARMLAIEAASVISGVVSSDNLILTRKDGTTINAGNVRGPAGPQGPAGTMQAATAGGDLVGSSYPNPVIAALKVTTGKIADLAITTAKLADLAVTDAKVAAANKDGAVGVPSMRTIGPLATQSAAGNHVHQALAGQSFMDRSASAAQSMPDSTFTKILLPNGTLENIDYSAGDFTVNSSGVYLINCILGFAANSAGRRILTIRINGTEVQRTEVTPNASGVFTLNMSQIVRFAVGDTFNMQGWQSSGGNLNTYVTTPTVGMQAMRIGA